MFQKARFKLTAWYLLIIMSISVLFSVTIYKGSTHEIERFARVRHFRLERDGFFPPSVALSQSDQAVVQEAEDRLKTILVLINLGILTVSGGVGYFLAGRTLRPIQDMVDEQNRFIADASHEFSTPITSLKSEIEVYMRSKNHTVKEADALLASNLEEVNNLQVLSDNLLELAINQKTNGDYPFELLSLSAVVQEAVKRVGPLAKKKHITITNTVHDASLTAERQSITELFVILLDNAIKYSPQNSKVLISSKKQDVRVSIFVKDEGIGISSEDLSYIFDRFYRADVSRSKAQVRGFGLGLSIAKKIVETHKGKIEAKSEINKGSTFIIHLPSPALKNS